MKYNLFKKEAASNWEAAKEKLLKSITLGSERVGKDYKKAFPYDYDPEVHFVYEGELTGPYRIEEDLSLYFFNQREQVENGYRILQPGEVLEGDTIKIIEQPPYTIWNEEIKNWEYKVELERSALETKIKETEKKLEDAQIRKDSRAALGMFLGEIEHEITMLLNEHSDLCHSLSLLVD